jgi:3-hydroxyisobutyrate dehydrogenase-like beta-hydroxyacid dehydrogenase
MGAEVVGLLHPGEMGTAVGAVLVAAGHEVLWASDGRSEATAARARAAGLADAGSVERLAARCAVVISVCPPHAALDVASALPACDAVYVDANATSPALARRIAGAAKARGGVVDGGIVGPPPRAPGDARLFLSGVEAPLVAALFTPGGALQPVVLGDEVGAASALKMVYAAWTKGSAALLLALRAAARGHGVEEALVEEWERSQPALPGRSRGAAASAAAKGWRWVAEMEEIAATLAAAGQPDGFHRAAAEVYERVPRADDDVLDALLGYSRRS